VARDEECGQTPLHIMLDLDMFDAKNAARMIKLRPDVLLMQDVDGKVPLHYVVKDDCHYFEIRDWQEAVELIARKCPAAILVHDHVHGKSPMHDAARYAVPWMVLQTMIQHCPAGVFDVDQEGNIPLFHAADAKGRRHGGKEDAINDVAAGIYNNRDDERNCLSNIYSLVQYDPSLLVRMYFRQGKSTQTDILHHEKCHPEETYKVCAICLPSVASSRKRKRTRDAALL